MLCLYSSDSVKKNIATTCILQREIINLSLLHCVKYVLNCLKNYCNYLCNKREVTALLHEASKKCFGLVFDMSRPYIANNCTNVYAWVNVLIMISVAIFYTLMISVAIFYTLMISVAIFYTLMISVAIFYTFSTMYYTDYVMISVCYIIWSNAKSSEWKQNIFSKCNSQYISKMCNMMFVISLSSL